ISLYAFLLSINLSSLFSYHCQVFPFKPVTWTGMKAALAVCAITEVSPYFYKPVVFHSKGSVRANLYALMAAFTFSNYHCKVSSNPFKYLKPFFSEFGNISFKLTINFENIRRFADHGKFFLFQKLLKHLESHTLIPESKFQQISFL